jgi:hypothetical protein
VNSSLTLRPIARTANVHAMQKALEKAGIQFIEKNAGGKDRASGFLEGWSEQTRIFPVFMAQTPQDIFEGPLLGGMPRAEIASKQAVYLPQIGAFGIR